MTATMTPYRSGQQAGRDGFWQLLRSEWTKFRTIRGWLLASALAVALIAFMPILIAGAAKNSTESCQGGGQCQVQGQGIATGPNGDAVVDHFYFVRQPLVGNGDLTAEVTAPVHAGPVPTVPNGFPAPPATQPWAKAGLIIKASTKPGSAYAAVMLTGHHGVRMQYDYTHDIAGIGTGSPLWLRLTRSGDLIEGYDSTDGTHWTLIGTARLANLPTTVLAGMFAASPDFDEASTGARGGDNSVGGPTIVTASLRHLTLTGRGPAGQWTGSQVGSPAGGGGPGSVHVKCDQPPCKPGPLGSGYQQAGSTFVVRGTGDIAPFAPIVNPVQVSLYGALFGLLVVIALAALFITAEYRRGLIRTTLAANPRRGRVLLAKAIVIGLVSFVIGTVGTTIAYPITERKLNSLGWTPPVWHVYPLTSGVGLQVVLGTGALVSVTAIMALAGGTIMRRSAGAVTIVIAVVVLPLVLSIILPLTAAQWMLRLTPAAAFGLQQAAPRYTQVANSCAPYHGCFPLAPWNGFTVMCAWAVLALGLAMYLLRRRDA